MSFGFTRALVRDLLSFPAFADATVALMDIDPQRLEYITRAVNHIVEEGHYPAKVLSTMDRVEALKGADGVVCTIEIAATLPEGEKPKDKHEIITRRGIACDVVVDAQLRQESIYVFGEKNEAFTDVDFECYGLTADEVATVRAAFALARDGGENEAIEAGKRLEEIAGKVKRSAESGEREAI